MMMPTTRLISPGRPTVAEQAARVAAECPRLFGPVWKRAKERSARIRREAGPKVVPAPRPRPATLGGVLAGMEKNRGGRPSENRFHDGTSLSDIGIERMQSHRWQRVASLPKRDFESHIAETRASGDELTTAGALRLAA